MMTPWPKYCQVYMTSNPCNKYEMSIDGKTILSCDIAEMCMTVMATPKCVQWYPGYGPDGEIDEKGDWWFLIKDSGSGARNGNFPGYYFYHEDFVKLKMMTFTIHKDAVKSTLDKFNK